jgi:hypothetical protein
MDHRCFATSQNEMIREKVNGRAEKLFRSASWRGSALQGVPVSSRHCMVGRVRAEILNEWAKIAQEASDGHLCYTLRAYSNAKCQRHLFDEAHRSWSGDYPAQHLQFFSQIQCSAQAAWDNAAQHPPQANAAISSRFNFEAPSDKYFLGQRGLNGTVDDRPGPFSLSAEDGTVFLYTICWS